METFAQFDTESETPHYCCKHCGRWADLHSSCGRVREFVANGDDSACKDFYLSSTYKVKEFKNDR